ncbi:MULTISPECIES: Eco57I restriction-modification methylase domain-containing protein [Chryseobacterium]|uniref:Eco57I restriction-modification methylase domain-containing protein n=1 Tax=Chryseobacterium TaxID=59732 RepID=UPI003594358A
MNSIKYGGLNSADDGYFDIVIGNPPYVDSETMIRSGQEVFRKYLKENYSYAEGNWDLFIVFIELAKKLTKINSIFSYIIPNKLISAKYGTKARSDLKRNDIIEIRDYSRLNVFTSADVYPVTFVIKKSNNPSDISPKFTIMNDIKSPQFSNNIGDVTLITDNSWDICFYNTDVFNLLMKLRTNNNVLKNLGSKVLGAATVNEAYLIKDKLKDSSYLPTSFKLINTGTIDSFISLWGIKKTQYIKGQYNTPVINKEEVKLINETRFTQSSNPKIIIAGMSSTIEAFLDVKGEYLAGKSTSIITDTIENLKVYLAILNSKVVHFYVNQIYNSLKMAGGYLNITPEIIKNIPIPLEYKNSKLIDIVNLIISNDSPSYYIEELNKVTFKLYNLTYEEVKIIDVDFSLSKQEYNEFEI